MAGRRSRAATPPPGSPTSSTPPTTGARSRSARSTTCASPSRSSRPTGTARRRGGACAPTTCARSTARSARRRFDDRRAPRGPARSRRSCSRAARSCSATGSRTPTPTTRAAAGASPSRRRGARRVRPERRLRARARSATLTPGARAARGAGLAHLPARRDAVGRGASIGALTRPETWPDYASELGRFTPLRPGGLAGQTFEIEVAAGTESGRPALHARLRHDHAARHAATTPPRCAAWFDDARGRARPLRRGRAARRCPRAATPLAGFDLTTHEGHFMGAGHNRLVALRARGRGWLRAAGTWDPMPWHARARLRGAPGSEAQHAFWGEGDVERLSMLHQLARADRRA